MLFSAADGLGEHFLTAVSDHQAPDANALADELDTLAHHTGRLLSRVRVTADEVELFVERKARWGWRIDNQALTPDNSPAAVRVVARVFNAGRVGVAVGASVEPDDVNRLIETALKTAAPSKLPPPPAPQARRPGPMTFDPDLADALAGAGALRQIAFAIMDNTWHEASRIDGLEQLSGTVRYQVDRHVIGNSRGVLASLSAAVGARVDLNRSYGDLFQQTHAPESFQPLALLGARAWRSTPRQMVDPAGLGLSGRVPVVLHPRLLEQLVRKIASQLLTEKARADGRFDHDEGERVADRSVTLIDDPGLDGLATSRAFDDEGRPTRRLPLIARGRLTQLLRSRETAAELGTAPFGSMWRDADGLPRVGFGSLLMERGDLGFHELIAAVDSAILVHEVEDFSGLDPQTGVFECRVRWGVSLERDRASRLLAPGQWTIKGRLFGSGKAQGLLDKVLFSRELYDTGSAILPYALTELHV